MEHTKEWELAIDAINRAIAAEPVAYKALRLLRILSLLEGEYQAPQEVSIAGIPLSEI